MTQLLRRRRIWIDLDNSPHVPLFFPIIQELERRGHLVFITARETFQVIGLADFYKLAYRKIGKHYGANKILKVLGTIWRSAELARVILLDKPDISISHGSRSLILLSSILRIPTVLLFDYEFAKTLPFIRPEIGIAPEALGNSSRTKRFKRGLRTYEGIKEDVYVPTFKPSSSTLPLLNLGEEDIVVTIRPPATEAHYHNRESEALYCAAVEFLGQFDKVRMVILPRNERTQKDFIHEKWPEWCREQKIVVPQQVVNGLDLIWHSDLVISGGGTMNREAAALGVPVYSIFRGPVGAVDRYLSQEGRLILLETVEDIKAKIQPVKRVRSKEHGRRDHVALSQIMMAIEEVIESCPPRRNGTGGC